MKAKNPVEYNGIELDIENEDGKKFLETFSAAEILLLFHQELPHHIILDKVEKFKKKKRENQDFWDSPWANQTI